MLFAVLAFFSLTTGASAHRGSAREAAAIPFAGAPRTSIVYGTKGLAFNPTSVHIFLPHSNAITVFNTTNRTLWLLDAKGKVVLILAPASNQVLGYSARGTCVSHLKGYPRITFSAIVS